MKLENVKKVGIIGCGAMGPTIAAVVAIKYPVVVKEVNKKLADNGFESISQCFPALVRRNVITEVQKEVAISQVNMTTELADLKDCQVIIDAVPDILELKIANFAELDKVCSPDTVFATTSSNVSITALAAGSGRPDKVIGTHYNYPAYLMALVEVAPAVQTSQETVDFTMAFLKDGLGKTPVKCKDSPGFIVNYLFFPYLVSAIHAVELGKGTVDEIDSLEDIDVSQSPLLQAVVRGFEEMAEIVQGSVPFAHYSPTLSLGIAADVFGLTKFFELTALDPEAALKLADVCGRKWLEIMRLQEQAVGGRWANHEYQPGIVMGAWDDELSPRVHRRVILPHFRQMAEAYGSIFVHLGLTDASLLRDYLQLPGVCGCLLKLDWDTEPVVDALQGTGVLQAAFNYHFHGGQKLETPVDSPWEDCCRHLERFAGKLRIMAIVNHRAPTPEKRKEGILRDLEDLKRVWEHVA